MNKPLSLETLAQTGAQIAVLGVGGYALPVPFSIRESVVECRVPTWSGLGDALEEKTEVEVTFVAFTEMGRMNWVFLRGLATLVPDPDWRGLRTAPGTTVDLDDLYHVLRIVPKRIELVNEERGWGIRETVDL